jgi:hypothetical protein
VPPPSQQTCHSPKWELIWTGVFKRRNFVSRRIRERHSWLGKGASVKATTVVITLIGGGEWGPEASRPSYVGMDSH